MTNTRFFEKTDLVQGGKIEVGSFVGLIGSEKFGQIRLLKPGGWFIVRTWSMATGEFTGWNSYRRAALVGPIPESLIEELKGNKWRYGKGLTANLPGGIRVTADELVRIRATAKASSLTFSAWVRSKLLN